MKRVRQQARTLDGREQTARRLTNTGISGHFLRWTDAGDAVIFRCTCGGNPAIMSVPGSGGEPMPFAIIAGGAHISFSPDYSGVRR